MAKPSRNRKDALAVFFGAVGGVTAALFMGGESLLAFLAIILGVVAYLLFLVVEQRVRR